MCSEEDLDRLIGKREAEVEQLADVVAVLPKMVPIDTVLTTEKIVKLERKRKVLVDAIKLTAYRAESALAPDIPQSRVAVPANFASCARG